MKAIGKSVNAAELVK